MPKQGDTGFPDRVPARKVPGMRALALLLIPLAAPAGAACPDDSSLFACQIGAKRLDICQSGKVLTYSFGPSARPELSLAEPLETIAYLPYSGFGRSRTYSVTFQNDGHSYEVWSSYDRIGEGAPVSAGVTVKEGRATVAELTCNAGTVTRELEGIGFLKQDLGQCFDWESSSWRMGPCGQNPEFCAC